MASATLYDDDILTWSEQQGAALRSRCSFELDHILSEAFTYEAALEELYQARNAAAPKPKDDRR